MGFVSRTIIYKMLAEVQQKALDALTESMVDHQSFRCIYRSSRASRPDSAKTKPSAPYARPQFLYFTYAALMRLGSRFEGPLFWSSISAPWNPSPASSASNPRRGANSIARDSADVIVHIVRGRMSFGAGREKVSRIDHPSRRHSNLKLGMREADGGPLKELLGGRCRDASSL